MAVAVGAELVVDVVVVDSDEDADADVVADCVSVSVGGSSGGSNKSFIKSRILFSRESISLSHLLAIKRTQQ